MRVAVRGPCAGNLSRQARSRDRLCCASAGTASVAMSGRRDDTQPSVSAHAERAWDFFRKIGSPKYHVAPMVDQVLKPSEKLAHFKVVPRNLGTSPVMGVDSLLLAFTCSRSYPSGCSAVTTVRQRLTHRCCTVAYSWRRLRTGLSTSRPVRLTGILPASPSAVSGSRAESILMTVLKTLRVESTLQATFRPVLCK